MIIVSGIPFSGTSIMLKKLKKGGLEIIPDLKVKDAISGNNAKAAFISALELKQLKGDHQIIFMNRNLKECFSSMERRIKKPPHKSAFEVLLANLKRHLKKSKNVFNIDYINMELNPKTELEKIKHLIPDFEKATKKGLFW